MEDYIEMIYRKVKNKYITIKELSENLNVKASSVSKMGNKLKELNLVNFERYGKINLTKEGIILGKYLLHRHNVLKNFFKKLNKEKYNLEQVEKVEHFMDIDTIYNLEKLLSKI
ncbi:MAG: metal-dependent transcriptional regulator [Bacilli bacterium]|nr:metal-dependent transcriptional regulator [Bacilli bacterium]